MVINLREVDSSIYIPSYSRGFIVDHLSMAVGVQLYATHGFSYEEVLLKDNLIRVHVGGIS